MTESQLPPGPELDCAVATEFMGWHSETVRPYEENYTYHKWVDNKGVTTAFRDRFSPSTDPAACELVKAELVRRGWEVAVKRHLDGHVLAVANKPTGLDQFWRKGTTEPHAVALLAVAVGTEGAST